MRPLSRSCAQCPSILRPCSVSEPLVFSPQEGLCPEWESSHSAPGLGCSPACSHLGPGTVQMEAEWGCALPGGGRGSEGWVVPCLHQLSLCDIPSQGRFLPRSPVPGPWWLLRVSPLAGLPRLLPRHLRVLAPLPPPECRAEAWISEALMLVC